MTTDDRGLGLLSEDIVDSSTVTLVAGHAHLSAAQSMNTS
jgi:hypothetical protein